MNVSLELTRRTPERWADPADRGHLTGRVEQV